jgi:branched-subunit amino acid transport protein
MNLDEFVLKYAVLLSKRNSIKQKKLVLTAVHQDFGAFGYEVKGITEKRKGRVSMNIQIGDLHQAKTLIVAPYDMPPRRFFSKGYHPFREEDSYILKIFSENILALVSIVFAFAAFILSSSINTILSYVVLGIFTALILSFTFIFPRGLSCNYTANKNNSSLAVMLNMAEALKSRKDIAFVLLDHVSLNHHGELMLSTLLTKSNLNPMIIYLDCVGYGDAAVISGSAENQILAKKLSALANESLRFETKTYNQHEILLSTLNRFPKALYVSVGVLKGKHWSVPKVRTPKDNEINDSVIQAITRVLLEGL